MVGPCLIVQRVLNKLEARDANGIKGQVVCAARVPVSYGCYAQVPERLHPLLEDGIHRGIALGVDAPNFARSVVDVEIGGDEFLLGFELEWPRYFSDEFRQSHLIRSGRERGAAKVLVCVALAAKESFFFSGPQGNSDGSPRLHLNRVQDAHNLQRNDRACPVIRRTGTRDPAVQMTANHDDFVPQLGVGSWNFGHRVEAMLVVSSKFGFHVHLNRDGYMLLQQAKDPAIAFDLGNHHGKRHSRIPMIRSSAQRGAVVVKDDPRASTVLAITARNDDGRYLLLSQERNDLSGKPGSLDEPFHARLRIRISTF